MTPVLQDADDPADRQGMCPAVTHRAQFGERNEEFSTACRCAPGVSGRRQQFGCRFAEDTHEPRDVFCMI
jgi:hypothetical protein